MMTKLTDAKLQKLKAADKRYDISDGQVPGLIVRVSPHGTKSFCLVIRYPGSTHPSRRSLGKCPTLSLKEARAKAIEWRRMVENAVDPKEELKRKRLEAAAKKKTTVAHVVEAYITAKVNGLRSYKQIAGDLRREVIPRWGERPITSITRVEVIGLVREIAAPNAKDKTTRKSGGPFGARNVYAATRAMFRWAVDEGVYGLVQSPCAGIDIDDKIGLARKSRDRILTDVELKALWRASSALGYPWGSLFQLLLLTGARRDEIASARWSELDGNQLRIPAARVKNNEQNIIALSDMAMEIVNALPRVGNSSYMFTVSGAAPVSGFSATKKRLDRLMAAELGCAPLDLERGHELGFVIHDLRRTVRSRLAALKVDYVVSELILGHSLGGIHGVYNKHGYLDEKREALNLWASSLRKIVGDADQPGLFNGNLEARV
jgi:integrase